MLTIVQEEEAKQLRKEHKKALKNSSNVEETENAEETGGFDGITSIGSVLKASAQRKKSDAKGKGKATTIDEDDDVPVLMNSEYANLKSVLDKADVVLHVLDSRDPLAYRSSHLQEYVKGSEKGKVFLVLNKIGTSSLSLYDRFAGLTSIAIQKILVRESQPKHGLKTFVENSQPSSSAPHPHSCPSLTIRTKLYRRTQRTPPRH